MHAIHEAVGPDVDLLLDVHPRMAPVHAIELANDRKNRGHKWRSDLLEAL